MNQYLLLWQKTYGGSLNETGNSLVKTTEGNYMICGSASSANGDLTGQINHGVVDCWIFKINDNGDLLWQKSYGGSQNDNCTAILTAPNGGYVFSGTTQSNDGDVSGNSRYSDAWIVKLTEAGSIAWQKFFGGADADYATIRDIDASGKILMSGYTFSRNGDITGFQGTEDMWTLQLDANGNKLNSVVFGGKSDDTAQDIVTNSDGSYTSIGRTGSTNGNVTFNHGGEDVWIVKFKF